MVRLTSVPTSSGRVGTQVAVEVEDLLGAAPVEEDRPGEDHRADRVQAELERRDDAEVAAAAAQAPQQLAVLVLVAVDVAGRRR